MNKQDGGITAVCIAIIIACIIALVHEAKAEPIPKVCNLRQSIVLTVGKAMNDTTSEIIKQVQKAKVAEEWESLGTWRITEYCVHCDTTAPTASGKYPAPGMVAMNGVPLGTIVRVYGQEYEVADRCGIDGTVDIFKDWGDGQCHCSLLDYQEVEVKR